MSHETPHLAEDHVPQAQGLGAPVLSDSLSLDRRARAMLKAMGIQWMWPTTAAQRSQQAGQSLTMPTAGEATHIPTRSDAPDAAAPPPAQPRHARSPVALKVSPVAVPLPAPDPLPGRMPVEVSDVDWLALPATIATCQSCELSDRKTATVSGWGSPQATWLFVIEGLVPSDQGPQPVNGEEWALLQAMWLAMNLSPEQVYVTSLTKCRPAPGVTVGDYEAQQCVAFVHRQIALLRPHMVVALGLPVAQALLPESAHTFKALGQWRSQLHTYTHGSQASNSQARHTPVTVTYPLASLIRTPIDKGKVWADVCMALDHVSQAQVSPLQAGA